MLAHLTPQHLQPFILDSSYDVGVTIGNDTYPAPVPYNLLKSLTPTDGYLLANDTRLAGVDYEYTKLVFQEMLQANIVYWPVPNFPELYLAIRNETCQVGVTAAEMDPSRTLCTSACPGPPFFLNGDYAAGGYDDATLAEECCLEYGAPYLSQGFALLSLLKLAPFDVASALFNADVGNAVLVILLMTASAGFIMHVIERDNPHLGSFSRSSYWSLMTFFLLADQTPLTKQGRFLQVVWLATNLVSMSVITSIIAAKLTTSSLVVLKVETLADVTSGLCQETGYPVAANFVKRSPNKPSTVVYAVIDECIAMLMNGTVQAVLSDAPVLNWFVSNYGLSGTYISGILYSNPFSFVYSSLNNVSDALRLYANPAVIGTLTDDAWISKFDKIKGIYISSGASAPPDATATPINPLFLKPTIVLVVFIFVNAILTGELGPGLPTRWRATAALRRFLSAPPGEDEDGGGDAKAEEAKEAARTTEAQELMAAAQDAVGDLGSGHHAAAHHNGAVVRIGHRVVVADDHKAQGRAAPHNDGAPSEKQVELLVTLLAPLLAELREVKADVQALRSTLQPPSGRRSSSGPFSR